MIGRLGAGHRRDRRPAALAFGGQRLAAPGERRAEQQLLGASSARSGEGEHGRRALGGHALHLWSGSDLGRGGRTDGWAAISACGSGRTGTDGQDSPAGRAGLARMGTDPAGGGLVVRHSTRGGGPTPDGRVGEQGASETTIHGGGRRLLLQRPWVCGARRGRRRRIPKHPLFPRQTCVEKTVQRLQPSLRFAEGSAANAESMARCPGTGDPSCWGESHGEAVGSCRLLSARPSANPAGQRRRKLFCGYEPLALC